MLSLLEQRPHFGTILLALLISLVFLPVAGNGWVNWDDGTYVYHNHAMTAPDGLWRIWFTWETQDYYPITFTLLWLQHACWGLWAGGYHLVSLLLHLINARLLRRLIIRLGLSPQTAWWVAAVFAIHPVQVESVAWVTEQKNLLYAAFGFSSWLAYLRFVNSAQQRWWMISLMLFIAGMLSKAMLLSLPLVLLLCGWWQRWPRKRFWPLLLFMAAGGLLAWNLVQQQYHHMSELGKVVQHSPDERLQLVSLALWFYPAKLLWPAELFCIYPLWPLAPDQWTAYYPALGWLIVGMVIGWLTWRQRISRVWGWALAYYFITVGPVIGLIDTAYMDRSFVADRYQYTPMIGGVLLAGWLMWEQWGRRRPILQWLALLMLLPLGWFSSRQVTVWHDPITLWSHTARYNPDSWAVQNGLGNAQLLRENYAAAVAAFEQARQLNPQSAKPLIGLAWCALRQEQPEAAIQWLDQAASMTPLPADYWYIRGLTLEKLNRLEEAIDACQQTLKLKPYYLSAHRSLVRLYMATQQPDSATPHIELLMQHGWPTDVDNAAPN
ncbi:MAG: hypothetical protein HJJLKODD_00118 [Phycisphaerae bacterium]|nr:hypothetical protein [Phycisphaerae bacterium]